MGISLKKLMLIAFIEEKKRKRNKKQNKNKHD